MTSASLAVDPWSSVHPAGAVRPLLPHGQGQFVAPAGQIAEFVAGAVVVGGLAFASWLAYKQFGTHAPSFQVQQTDTHGTSNLQVTPQTIALAQAQLRWIGTNPVPPLGTVIDPTALSTSLSPTSLAMYAAVPLSGQLDLPTLNAIAAVLQDEFLNNSPNNLISTATAQQDPWPTVQALAATTGGQQQLLNEVDMFYQLWTDAANNAAAPAAPKPAGRSLLPHGQAQFAQAIVRPAGRPLLPHGQAQFARAVVRPAGQVAMPANAPPGTVGADAYGQCVDAGGNALNASGQSLGPSTALPGGAVVCNAAAYTAATGAPAPIAAAPPPSTTSAPGGMPDAAQLALINAVAMPLNTTATSITNAITTNDAAQIAILQQQAQQQAAILLNQGAAAQAQGLTALAMQRQQQANQMQQFNQYLAFQQAPMNTVLWIGVVVVVLGIVTYLVYASGKNQPAARADTRAVRSTNRSARAESYSR